MLVGAWVLIVGWVIHRGLDLMFGYLNDRATPTTNMERYMLLAFVFGGLNWALPLLSLAYLLVVVIQYPTLH